MASRSRHLERTTCWLPDHGQSIAAQSASGDGVQRVSDALDWSTDCRVAFQRSETVSSQPLTPGARARGYVDRPRPVIEDLDVSEPLELS